MLLPEHWEGKRRLDWLQIGVAIVDDASDVD